jgi:hypothetical protein
MENRIAFDEHQSTRMIDEKELAAIEAALEKVCPFGEVRLVVERGRLRWLVIQQSLDLLKLSRGQE